MLFFFCFCFILFERGRQQNGRDTHAGPNPPPDYALTFAHFSFTTNGTPHWATLDDWLGCLASNRQSLCLCVISCGLVSGGTPAQYTHANRVGSYNSCVVLFFSWTIWRSRKSFSRKAGWGNPPFSVKKRNIFILLCTCVWADGDIVWWGARASQQRRVETFK